MRRTIQTTEKINQANAKRIIYRHRYGQEYDLTDWPKDHLDLLRQAYWHYCHNMPYSEFIPLILGPGSPVLDRKRNGPEPVDSPLYAVATDLQFRLAVKQGVVLQDWDGPIDPVWPL